jgi:hypothetical protein
MASDFIDIGAPVSNSRIDATVKPGTDGDFMFKVYVAAKGNGQPDPEIWAELKNVATETTDKSTHKMRWQNGDSGLREMLRVTKHLKQGTVYNFQAIGGNEHADATDIQLKISRI